MRNFLPFLLLLGLSTALAICCSSNMTPAPSTTLPSASNTSISNTYTYRIVNSYPHDPDSFTQGLQYEDGILYEGTGQEGSSKLRKVTLETGQIMQEYKLPSSYFGEGITIWDDRIIQLTWQARMGFVYDKESFRLLRRFNYPTEGWGITHDNVRLIMSDGTSALYFLDPETLQTIGQIEVHDENGPILEINELEYIQGYVYANIWKTNTIAIIDPETGKVVSTIDLSGLLSFCDINQPIDVLNGIAYDAENDRLFVTGKLWPKLFEIELIPDPR